MMSESMRRVVSVGCGHNGTAKVEWSEEMMSKKGKADKRRLKDKTVIDRRSRAEQPSSSASEKQYCCRKGSIGKHPKL